MMKSDLSTVSLIPLTCGNLGMSGAPILNMMLMCDAQSGMVTGQGMVTQAVAAPNDVMMLRNLTGSMHVLGAGGANRVMMLRGECMQMMMAPAIGQMMVPFEACFLMDKQWMGHGTFMCGQMMIDNAPVKQRG